MIIRLQTPKLGFTPPKTGIKAPKLGFKGGFKNIKKGLSASLPLMGLPSLDVDLPSVRFYRVVMLTYFSVSFQIYHYQMYPYQMYPYQICPYPICQISQRCQKLFFFRLLRLAYTL